MQNKIPKVNFDNHCVVNSVAFRYFHEGTQRLKYRRSEFKKIK